MSWPYNEDEETSDRETWIDMVVVPNGWRKPTQLKEMPQQGKVVIGHPTRWQATAYHAAKSSLDFFLNELTPQDQIYEIDLDEFMR